MTNKEFIQSIAPAARSDMAASGILFGMKATLSGNTWASDWDGSTYRKPTKEQDTSGKEFTIPAVFRKYASWAASIKDHSDYLIGAMNGSKTRYAGLSGCKDYRTAAQLIKDGGYATDIAYVDKLCKVIEDNNLTQYDGGMNMQIREALLTISNYNRPGTKRGSTTAIACHYIGNPGTSAQANRNYFESLRTEGPALEKKGKKATKASCHFLIGLQGEILQLIPEDEISWCTNQANSYTISIEACHPDSTGKFNDATYQAYVELCADLCSRWGLDPLNGGLIRHYDVTGKFCPKYFVDHPDAWARFESDVAAAMAGEVKKSGWYEEDGGRRFYLGNTGECVRNKWYPDGDKWYWFDGSGMMVTNVWYEYKEKWFYLGSDGAMVKGLLRADGKWYFMNDNGEMVTEPVVLTPGDNGALKYPGLVK